VVAPATPAAEEPRLEEMRDKTVLLFTPHPDDDLFGAGGTIALLNRNHNKVFVCLYTNDDKGSYDLEMTSQRLARIQGRGRGGGSGTRHAQRESDLDGL